MVEVPEETLDSIFRALSDATRRDMLRRLSLGEHTVGELAEPFDMSLAAASKHIRMLENAGLVKREIQGRTHVCRLAPDRLAAATGWLQAYEHFWNKRLDTLATLLKDEDSP